MAYYDFEPLEVMKTTYEDVPRVALISGKMQDFTNAQRDGVKARYPKRDSHARAGREKRLRPRVRLIVANPQTLNRALANIPERHEGFILHKFMGS